MGLSFPPIHICLADNPSMKTEVLLWRQAEENSTRVDQWPWLVPDHNPGVKIVTLFEGVIQEDGTVIPPESGANHCPASGP